MNQLNRFLRSRVILLGAILALFCSSAWAQVTVTGTLVSASDKQPLIGATVLVKGTNNGATTDAKGKFSLKIDNPADAVLIITYLGYLPQEVAVQGRSVVDVELAEDVKQLDEVVVVGYGTVKKKDLTGSVASIKTDDVTKTASSNAMQSLQAKMPGVDIQQTDGQSGSPVNITLRGQRSISASNAPLILVDGVEYGATLDLNPSDIESMDVLKDASSTAIYGTKGANGVIIITTKRGKSGKSVVNFSAYMSTNKPTNIPKVMYGQKEVQRYIDAANYKADFISGNWGTSNLTAADVLKMSLADGTTEMSIYQDGSYTNWNDLILKNGQTQNYEFSVSGGSERTNYDLSLGLMNEGGLMRRDELNRYNGKITIDHTVNKMIKAGGSVFYTYKDNDKRNSSVFTQTMKMTTITHPYLNDGTINITPNPHYPAHCNPLLDDVPGNYQNNIQTSRIFGNTYLEITPIKNLVFKSMFALDKTNSRNGLYQDYQSVGRFQSPSTTLISNETKDSTRYTWDNTLNYSAKFEKHDISVLLGQSATQSVYQEALISGTAGQEHYYTSSFYDLSKITTASPPTSIYTKTSMLSFFGRVNYKFNEKYLLTATLRTDGSSTLAPGHKWGYFPSVSAAWRVSEEPFLAGQKAWLSNLKLRASWGSAGNAAVQPYKTITSLSQYTVYYYLNG
ncbi:MAG TPA: SusC/RagA family TonB-linked outer membrane protein, partial [Bacteroidales bacterium]